MPVVGVVDPVDPDQAPHPRSDGEALLLATVHPPLVRLDCAGELRSGVAAGWELISSGEGEVVWRLEVPGPRGRADGVALALARPAPAGSLHRAGVERTSAGVVLRLEGEGVRLDGPRVLAERELVPLPGGDGGWSSPHSGLRLEPVPDPGPGVTLHLLADSPEGRDTLALVRVVPGGDPRDLLDEGAHLVLTRDPRAVAWASSRPNLRVVALPADRAYRLAIPGVAGGALPPGLSAGLVQDVVPLGRVPGEGRGGESACAVASPAASPVRPGGRRPRVVHLRGDATARALAERLAALAGPGGSASLATLLGTGPGAAPTPAPVLEVVGLEPEAFDRALRNGGDVAYLLREPARPAAPCTRAAARTLRAPWIPGGSLLTLVEVGPRALMAEGAPSLAVDGTGAVRIVFPGRSR